MVVVLVVVLLARWEIWAMAALTEAARLQAAVMELQLLDVT
jgi:hypothetical protein